jgi:hypothetical protein
MIRPLLCDDFGAAMGEQPDGLTTELRPLSRLLTVRLHNLNAPHRQVSQDPNHSDDTVTIYLKI